MLFNLRVVSFYLKTKPGSTVIPEHCPGKGMVRKGSCSRCKAQLCSQSQDITHLMERGCAWGSSGCVGWVCLALKAVSGAAEGRCPKEQIRTVLAQERAVWRISVALHMFTLAWDTSPLLASEMMWALSSFDILQSLWHGGFCYLRCLKICILALIQISSKRGFASGSVFQLNAFRLSQHPFMIDSYFSYLKKKNRKETKEEINHFLGFMGM